MTSTYTEEYNPWRTDGSLRYKLDQEEETQELAHNVIDMLGVVSVYAGRDFSERSKQRKSMFPGRALVTKRSDPARNVIIRKHQQRHFEMGQQMSDDDENNNQQQQQQPNLATSASVDSYGPPDTNFQYNNMSELEMFQESTTQQQQQQNQQEIALGSPPHLDQQHSTQQRKSHHHPVFGQNANNNNANVSHIHQDQQLYEQDPMQEMSQQEVDTIHREQEIAQQYDLHLQNSTRDIRRARQCRYGLQNEKRVAAAATPLDYRKFPATPQRFSTTRDLPLAVTGNRGDFVRVNEAYNIFPESRYEELHNKMETRKTGKAAALHKAMEEIKFHDRAMLVPVPWKFSNSKNNQVQLLGGGNSNVEVAQRDFLEKNAV